MRISIAAFFLISGDLYAQTKLTELPKHSRTGIIEHSYSSATVLADNDRPLMQAVALVSAEYGWLVDYEDPPYQNTDLVEIPAPVWRAQHPNGPLPTLPAGGLFQSTYPVGPEHQILSKIVSDYNSSANPGNFVVRKQVDDAYVVVGISTRQSNGALLPISPILDTRISIASGTRDALATITTILQSISRKTGALIVLNPKSQSFLMNSEITIEGNNVPARLLLRQTLDGLEGKTESMLLFDPESQLYVLTVIRTLRTP